jgi:hypothetical protein
VRLTSQLGLLFCSLVVVLLLAHTEARAGYVAARKSAAVDPLSVSDKEDLNFNSANDRSSQTTGSTNCDLLQDQIQNVPSHPLLIANTTTPGGAGAPSSGSATGTSVDAPASLYSPSVAHQQTGEWVVAESALRRPTHIPFVLFHPPRD